MAITTPEVPEEHADAFALAGIEMQPPPMVEFCKFSAGMDDHMLLLMRVPKNRIEEFWQDSRWSEENTVSKQESELMWRGLGRTFNHPILTAMRNSQRGLYCGEPVGQNGGLKAYFAFDLDADDVLVCIEWFEI